MWKYAGELCPGDVWTERKARNVARSYRVVATQEGPTATTVTVTGLCLITGEMLTTDFFLVTRVLINEASARLSKMQ